MRNVITKKKNNKSQIYCMRKISEIQAHIKKSKVHVHMSTVYY